MLLTLLCASLLIFSIAWIILDRKYDWDTDMGAVICTVIVGIWFLAQMICLSVGPSSTRADIKKFEAIRLTINQQRENKALSEFERVQLTELIIKQNEWLAGEQFWADNIWLNWFYDKKILEVKPVE